MSRKAGVKPSKWIEVVDGTHRIGFTPYRCFVEKAKGKIYFEKLEFADTKIEFEEGYMYLKHRLFRVRWDFSLILSAYDFFNSFYSDVDFYYLAWSAEADDDVKWAPMLMLANEPLADHEWDATLYPEETALFFIAPILPDEEEEDEAHVQA